MIATRKTRVSQSTPLKVDDLITLVYDGVSALILNLMQSGLKKSGKLLIDCIHTRDADKDGFLTYSEFEDLLM